MSEVVTAADRRARAPDRRRDRPAAGLGAPLRAARSDADRERLSALLERGRAPGGTDARAACDRRLRGRGGPARRSPSRRPHVGPPLEGVPVELGEAIRRLDDAAAHAAFDRLLARLLARRRARRRRAAAAARARRRLGEGRGHDRPGALRVAPRAGPAPRARPRLGSWQRPARGAGVPAGGAARSRPSDLRPRAARARLADHVPRRRHAAGDAG